jgi:hypothetical protein
LRGRSNCCALDTRTGGAAPATVGPVIAGGARCKAGAVDLWMRDRFRKKKKGKKKRKKKKRKIKSTPFMERI